MALRRKNYLFVGSDEAGRNLAGLSSLVATCEVNGVNPGAYLADVLMRLGSPPRHTWTSCCRTAGNRPPPPRQTPPEVRRASVTRTSTRGYHAARKEGCTRRTPLVGRLPLSDIEHPSSTSGVPPDEGDAHDLHFDGSHVL